MNQQAINLDCYLKNYPKNGQSKKNYKKYESASNQYKICNILTYQFI